VAPISHLQGRYKLLSWFAARWGVCGKTILRWSRAGKLPAAVKVNARLYLLPVKPTLAAFAALERQGA
jgi:hypothetical protein